MDDEFSETNSDEFSETNSEDSEDSREIERLYYEEQELIAKMFPGAKFRIYLSDFEMSELLSKKPSIVIKTTYSCDCYRNYPRPSEFFKISGNTLTYRFVIEELNRLGLDLDDCEYRALQEFKKTEGSDDQFDLVTGIDSHHCCTTKKIKQ
jgi:hypothetical protein